MPIITVFAEVYNDPIYQKALGRLATDPTRTSKILRRTRRLLGVTRDRY